MDHENPQAARAVARRELANLLAAVHTAFDAGAEQAVKFANNVSRFLDYFGLTQDRAALSARAGKAAGQVGSQAWVLARSNLGDQLYAGGQHADAEAVVREVLTHLPATPSFERCLTQQRLGRCLGAQGRLDEATRVLERALTESKAFEATNPVRRMAANLQRDLGDVLMRQGDYPGARTLHEEANTTKEAIGDQRGAAVGHGQLGTIAYFQGDLAAAEEAHREAQTRFHALGEPAMEATAWHQLGLVYQRAKAWPEAEAALREAARLQEAHGDRASAAASWDQLAQVLVLAGKPAEAEPWYRRALEARLSVGEPAQIAVSLNNLAHLLGTLPGRLMEARDLAEQVLAIDLTRDPAATEIWKTYALLAEIAAQQGNAAETAGFRRQSRDSFAAMPHAKETVRQLEGLINAVAAATRDPKARAEVEKGLPLMEEGGGANLASAIRRVLTGDRDEAALIEPLLYEDAVILQAILRRVGS